MSLDKLQKSLKEDKIIFGTDKTLKNLKLGKTKRVFLASNCPKDVREGIKKYDVEVVELKESSDEVALICKRPHSIIVLSC